MAIPPVIDRLADPLVSTIRQAWDEIVRRQKALADDPANAVKRRRLAELNRAVGDLMDEVDAEAGAWLRDTYPQVYATGAGDLAIPADFTWSRANVEAVKALAADTFDDLLKATRHVRRTTKSLVRTLAQTETANTLLAGQTARQGGRNLARFLEENGIHAVVYRDGSRHGLGEYGEMVVRTRSAIAYNTGALNHGTANGVHFYEVFDGAECGWTRHEDPDRANGTIRSAHECALTPLSHPNAVMAGSKVAPMGEILLAYRARWSGPVIAIRTTGGSRLTVGPNHPVLTDRGWIAADRLCEGDQVVRSPDQASTRPGGDFDQVPTRVEDMFAALALLGPHSRVVAAPTHFHGDGNFCEGEVEIVGTAGCLAGVGQTAFVEKGGECVLDGAGTEQAILASPCPGGLDVRRIDSPASGLMRRRHVGAVTGARADGDSSLAEPLAEDAVADADFLRQLFRAGAGQVTLDEVIEVRNVATWSGHAYDLQTTTGGYWCDGILVHNCRRSFGPRPDVTDASKAAPSTTPEQRANQAADEAQQAAATRRSAAHQAALQRRQALISGRNVRSPVAALSSAPVAAVAPDTARLAQRLVDIGAEHEKTITPAILSAGDEHGLEAAGLKYRLKGQGSLSRKLADDALDRGQSVAEVAGDLADVVRYTLTAPPESLVARHDVALRSLTDQGHTIHKYKNTWGGGGPYRGINVQLRDPDGYLYELQFHTPESFHMKNDALHEPYEEARLKTTSPERRAELVDYMSEQSDTMVVPDGILDRPDRGWAPSGV